MQPSCFVTNGKEVYSILPISGIFIILARVLKYVQLFLDSKEKKGENA